jgi:prolyl 4-hydroxylase
MPPSLGTILQYTFLAVLGYILAGAPLISLLTSDGAALPSSSTGRRQRGGLAQQPLSFEKAESLVIPDGQEDLECEEAGYRSFVLSREPLVVYLEGFLSEGEREEIVSVRWVTYFPSIPFLHATIGPFKHSFS